MKRTITKLEEQLINKTFRLDSKTYSGRYSQKVENYIYKGKVSVKLGDNLSLSIKTRVILDAKRTKILGVWIENIYDSYVSELGVKEIAMVYDYVNHYVMECETLCQE